MSAGEAAGELGVSLRTLYAYVSRGLIRSEAVGGRKRNKRYRAEDVRRLKERAEQRRDPGKVVEGALYWGTPVTESGITLISSGRLYYRGRDAVALSRGRTIEEVASLIWTGEEKNAPEVFGFEPPVPSGRLRAAYEAVAVADLAPVEACAALLPLAAAEDLAAYDLRPFSVARTGARVLRFMAAVCAGVEPLAAGTGGVAETLRRGWVPEEPGAARLLSAALVLCADHELTVSSFAARCVASSEATPYDVVAAGLAAVRGVKHGGQIELAGTFLREVEAAGDARAVIAARLRRGERIPGFGHSLYPGETGDPRGVELLRLASGERPRSNAVELASAAVEAAYDLVGEKPTLDLGLVTLSRALSLPAGGAVALFALGRTVGWVGHAIEQYEGGALIRPRARYTGVQPAGETAP